MSSSRSTGPRATARGRKHASPEARRTQILQAALRCFASRGYHAATMDELVEASGLSKGSLYWHFKSKQEVFLALFDAFTLDVSSAWQEVGRQDASSIDLLRRRLEIVLDRLSRDRQLLFTWAEFLTHEVARQQMAGIYRLTRQELGLIARRGIEAGELRALPPESIAASLIASVEGLLIQSMADPSFDPKRHFEISWEITLRGIRS